MSAGNCRVRRDGSWLVVLALQSAACSGHGGAAVTPSACHPVEGRLPENVHWDSLPGSWRLTLVAETGQMASRSVQGTMSLREQLPALKQVNILGAHPVTVPIIGTADIDLEGVGAVRLGDVLSTDPGHPGLAIWVSEGGGDGVSAILRIGEEAIRGDIVRFDGGYTALYLQHVSASSIRGGWASGVTTKAVTGYFCAERITDGR